MGKLVFIHNDRVLTDSLSIAKEFDKGHKEVLRDIDNQISKLEQAGESEWSQRNFAHTHYIHDQNKQQYRKFLLSEDAFAIVAMSYVTPKAMKMKVKFLNEFKQMKQKLQNKFNLPKSYKEAMLQLIEKEEQKEELETENKMYQQQIAENEPKLSYVDEILKSHDLILTSQIAEDYGMTATALNKLLHKINVQHKMNDQWLLYSKYKGNGYTKSETHPYTRSNGDKAVKLYTKWTQKGRLFLYELLKSQGVCPTMEQMRLMLIENKEGVV